jgi:hypothetical protein
MIIRRLIALNLLTAVMVSSAAAQPALDQLWPHGDGLSWTYSGSTSDVNMPPTSFNGRLIFDGAATFSPGVTVQNLVGQLDGLPLASLSRVPRGLSPLLVRLWMLRPELREKIAARQTNKAGSAILWPAILLAPAEIANTVGHRETVDRIGVWRDPISDWSWWFLTAELTSGAGFTLQLVPDLASDVFLHGTVRGNTETVSTGAGTFSNAVVVDYRVEFGTLSVADENGTLIGTEVVETTGWVAFVPNVGPVASSEDTTVLSVDCPTGCPVEESRVGTVVAHTDLTLSNTPVAVENDNWGALKGRW